MAEHIAYMKRIVDMTIPSILHEYHEMFKQRREAVLRHRQLISASSIVPEEGQPSTSKHLRHSHDESHIHTSNHFEIDALLSSWNHHGSHPQHHAQIHMLQNYIVDLRREDGIEHGHRRKFHRVFVRAIDSGEYGKLGWIVSSDVEHCMICYKHFETVLMSKKHHCRTCGNVVCRDCSIRQDFVEEIANIGMVRICQLCDYGQSPIKAIANDDLGVSMVEELEADLVSEEQQIQQHGADFVGESDWSQQVSHLRQYGDVKWCKVQPVLVFRAKRESDRSNVYINLCSCADVPFNSQHSLENEKIIYMVIGEKCIASNDCDLYEVAVSPVVVTHMEEDASGGYKSKVCEQILLAISLAQDERGFALYTFYNPGGGKYLHHKGRDPSSVAKQLLSEVDNDSDDGKASIFPHLAIPSSKAFEALHQIHSKFTDVGDVVEVRTQNEQEAEEQREVHSERHRHRLFARMMNRSLSQYYEHIKLDEKDQEQEKKTDDDSSAPAQSAPVHLQEAARSKINIPPPINTSNLTSAGSKREEERFITKIFAVLPLPGIVIKAKIVSGNEENHSPRKSFTEHADFPSALPQRRRSSTNSNFDDGPRGSDADDGDCGGDQQKVFVNVFHHKALDEMMLSERIRLPQVHVAVVGFGEVTEVRDKKGKSTPCYNIIVPSSSFVKSDHHAHLPIYSNAQLVYLLEQVNSHFSINLSTRDFVLPKVKAGFKGNPFIEPECFICKLDKSWMQSVSAPATPRSRTGSLIGEILHQIRPGHVTPRSDGSSFPTEVAPGNRSRLSSRDLESVVSDTGSHQNHGTPTAAAAAASRRKTLRSSITETLHLTPSDEGSRLLSVNMMIYTEDGSLTLAEVQAMKHQSVDEPAVLLGWQILLFQNFKRDVYVVTSMRKNHLSKTEFRLSAMGKEDLWTTLKRAENKSGMHFQPTRLVLPALRDTFPPHL